MDYATDFFLASYIVHVQFFWKFKFWFQFKDGLLEKKWQEQPSYRKKKTADLKMLTDLVFPLEETR